MNTCVSYLIFILNNASSAAEPQLTSNGSTTNTNTGQNSRVRGITCGKGARKAMAKAKGRLRVEFDFRAGKAICANAECFNNEIGIIVRSDCSLQYKEWRCVPKFVREPLRAKLLVSICLNSVRNFCDMHILSLKIKFLHFCRVCLI